jgi:hypothetical protein
MRTWKKRGKEKSWNVQKFGENFQEVKTFVDPQAAISQQKSRTVTQTSKSFFS